LQGREAFMLSIPWLLFLIGYPALVASGGYAVFLAESGEGISVLGSSGETVYTVSAEPGERLSYPAFRDLKLVFISSSTGLVMHDILTGETAVLCEEHTGAPWISSTGDLWYSKEGILYKNGASSGISIPAFSVSVEGNYAAFTDRNDNIHILNLETGQDRTVQGYRFYSPVILAGGAVVAPTLTGEIIYLPADGSINVLGNGAQPYWSSELGGFFFCVSEDDGSNITASDIWFVRPGSAPLRVTLTEGIFETRPCCSAGVLWFIDARTGIPGSVNLNDFSL
jgi:hypothetical protein